MDVAIERQIVDLLKGHRIMTLATLRPDGWPQTTTVGDVDEGLTLWFLCGLDSQKAKNLAHDNRVANHIEHGGWEVCSGRCSHPVPKVRTRTQSHVRCLNEGARR